MEFNLKMENSHSQSPEHQNNDLAEVNSITANEQIVYTSAEPSRSQTPVLEHVVDQKKATIESLRQY